MTHPTKAIIGTLLKDFVKVSGGRSDGALYSEKDLEKTLDVTEVIDFHQTIEVDGIQVDFGPTKLTAAALTCECACVVSPPCHSPSSCHRSQHIEQDMFLALVCLRSRLLA